MSHVSCVVAHERGVWSNGLCCVCGLLHGFFRKDSGDSSDSSDSETDESEESSRRRRKKDKKSKKKESKVCMSTTSRRQRQN